MAVVALWEVGQWCGVEVVQKDVHQAEERKPREEVQHREAVVDLRSLEEPNVVVELPCPNPEVVHRTEAPVDRMVDFDIVAVPLVNLSADHQLGALLPLADLPKKLASYEDHPVRLAGRSP